MYVCYVCKTQEHTYVRSERIFPTVNNARVSRTAMFYDLYTYVYTDYGRSDGNCRSKRYVEIVVRKYRYAK